MLKKDLMELCLLQLLSQGDKYGYEMLSRLGTAFPDTRESAAYAQLRALSQKGLAQRYEGQVSEGPARKYYRLTEAVAGAAAGFGGFGRGIMKIFRQGRRSAAPAVQIKGVNRFFLTRLLKMV